MSTESEKLQANAAQFVDVLSSLNSEQHLNLVNLAMSRQKIFSNHQNEKIHEEKSLPDTCRAVGVEVVYDSELFSDRLCNPCARKITNLGTLYQLVQSSMGSEAAACKTPPKQRINASKRLLETQTGSSPCRKSVRVNSAKASRNSLFARTAEQFQQALKECIDSNLNIDDLPTDGHFKLK